MNTFEMNSIRKDRDFCNIQINKKSPVVEIFSRMTKGKELNDLDGTLTNKSVRFIKGLAEKAKNGDLLSACELNNIRRIVIEPKIMKDIKLLNFFDSYKNLSYGVIIKKKFCEKMKVGFNCT